MSQADECLTIAEAAKYCGVNRGTIKRWVSERQLSRYMKGREAVIPKAQLEVVKEIRSMEDVIKEAAKSAGIPVDRETLVRMNTLLMTHHGKDVLELYDPVAPKVRVVRVRLEEL